MEGSNLTDLDEEFSQVKILIDDCEYHLFCNHELTHVLDVFKQSWDTLLKIRFKTKWQWQEKEESDVQIIRDLHKTYNSEENAKLLSTCQEKLRHLSAKLDLQKLWCDFKDKLDMSEKLLIRRNSKITVWIRDYT